MANPFVYGTLRHLPLLVLILGHQIDAKAATLPDHAVYQTEGHDFPLITAQAGAVAQGLLLRYYWLDRQRSDLRANLRNRL
jgi:ADP-ribose pyrophosphatase